MGMGRKKEEGRSHPPLPPQGGKFRKKEEGRRKYVYLT